DVPSTRAPASTEAATTAMPIQSRGSRHPGAEARRAVDVSVIPRFLLTEPSSPQNHLPRQPPPQTGSAPRMPPVHSCNDGIMPPSPRFLTLADVAEVLSTSSAQVYALVRRGELPAAKSERGGEGSAAGDEDGRWGEVARRGLTAGGLHRADVRRGAGLRRRPPVHRGRAEARR